MMNTNFRSKLSFWDRPQVRIPAAVKFFSRQNSEKRDRTDQKIRAQDENIPLFELSVSNTNEEGKLKFEVK